MKKIINPWTGADGYQCYGCDPNHPHGLRMSFYEDGDSIVSKWSLRSDFQGWINTLHGGIQSALVDEIASWVVFRKFQTSGVTSKMEVRYLKPIRTTDDYITLRANVVRKARNLVEIAVTITDQYGEECTRGTCLYFLFPQDRARDEFGFREFKTEDEI